MSSRQKRSGNYTSGSQRRTSAISRNWLRLLAGAGLIAGLCLVVYLPSLHGEFIMDDDLYLTDNPVISAPDGLVQFWARKQAFDYYPASNSILWLQWRLWGMDPTGYHATNLLLHIAAALLVWRLLWKLRIPGAFLAALLFAIHPLNVEGVAWIAQCKDVMAVMFFLVSILCYLRHEEWRERLEGGSDRRRGWWWYVLSLAAFVLAMLSKGTATTLPLTLLWIIWWHRRVKLSDFARVAPFFVLAALMSVLTIWFWTYGFQQVIRTASFEQRLLGAGAVVWFYLAKALLPVQLSFIYPLWQIHPIDVRWWLPAIAAAATSALLWMQRRRIWAKSLLFAWGFFCIALVPAMGLADAGFMQYSLVASHYEHLALIGVVASAAAGWTSWRARETAKPATMAVAAAAVAALALLALRQNYIFANPITLYSDALVNNPTCAMLHNNLGLALIGHGRFDEAIAQLQDALRLNSNYPEAHNNLAVALAKAGQPQQALEHLRQAIELKPDYPEAHFNMGLILAGQNQLRKAIRQYEESLRMRPDYPDAHNGLGIALARDGQLAVAIEHFQKTVDLKPDDAEAQYNLAVALFAPADCRTPSSIRGKRSN